MTKKTINPEEPDMATKVVLTVLERILFPSIMPQRGNTVSLELGLAIKKRVSFTPEEVKEYSIVYLPDGRTVRKPEKDNVLREFRFENYELLHIQQGARFLDENRMVEERNLELVKKFLAIKIKTKEQ